jgi:hypothetical protein
MDFLKMKEALAFIGILALAVSLWFLKEHSDKKLIDSKNETIKSLQDTVQSKEEIIEKNSALLDLKDEMIKWLRDTVQSKEDTIVKDSALLDSENSTIKSFKDTLQTKEAALAKDSAIISVYQQQLVELTKKNNEDKAEDKDNENIYPDDNGFDAEDLGSGFSAYQVFGPFYNPNHNTLPDRLPNHTPWKFGSGNSGIAANGSGYNIIGATNRDSNGATSTSGQAGVLEYKGSSISQTIMLPAGTFTVTFDYEARQNYSANQVEVSIDKRVLFKGTPTDCDNFKRVTTDSISLATVGKHELMFRGLGGIDNNSRYPATFIDNISINPVGSRTPDPNMGGVDTDIIENVHRSAAPPVVQESPK